MDVNRAATAHLGQWAALQRLPLRRSRVSREETSLSPHTSGLGLPEGAVSTPLELLRARKSYGCPGE